MGEGSAARRRRQNQGTLLTQNTKTMNTTTPISQDIESKITAFSEALAAGLDGIVKASEIYVAALDESWENASKFQSAFEDKLPASAWKQFEAVGRKWMHPRLIMGGMTDRRKANKVKKLTYSTQERIFNRGKFPLLIAGGDSLEIDLMEATHDQVAQICDGSQIRSLSAQKAWLEERALQREERAARKQHKQTETLPYVIGKGRVVFRRGTALTRAEIKRLLQEM